MRLRTLLIEKYGNLDHAALSFDPAPGCLNLLLAPNGAGKSVLRRSFRDLLFGIPLQSDMRFRFDYPGMHLRADAISVEGAEFAFGWQRKTGRIFPNAAGDPAASRWLAELLAAVSPRQVEMLFALDTERLRSGGRELAAGDGTLSSALLSGTGELASARALRRGLDDRRTSIWERGRSSRPLNAALSRLAAAAKQRREAVQTPKSLESVQALLAEVGTRRQQAAAAAEAAQAELGRLNRIALTRAPLAMLEEVESWLAAHPDAPVLPDGLSEALVRARHEASLAATRLEVARTQLAEAAARAMAIGRDEAADAVEIELAKLPGALGDARTKRRDGAARAWERDAALREVAAALRDIGSAVPPDQAGTIIPTLATMEAARERISQHTAAATTLALARARLAKAQTDMALLEGEAAAAPVLVPEGVEALLAEIRRSREPLGHAAELAQAAREALAAERACLARLPGWSGTASELANLPTLTQAAYDRLAQAVADAGSLLAKTVAERDRIQAQRNDWQRALAALHAHALPDAAALAAARAERDRGWRLIFARAFTQDADEAAERAYGGGDALPIAFERHLRAADALADARFGEVARVEQTSRLAADIGQSEPGWVASNAAVDAARQRHDAATAQWDAACDRLQLPLGTTLREVSALLAARDDAIAARSRTEIAQGAEAALAASHADGAARLAGLLGVTAGPLATLLPVADARVRSANLAVKDAVARDTRRAQAGAELRAATVAVTTAEAALARWQGGWEEMLAVLGRPAGESPAVTERVLGRLTELDREHRSATGLQARIDGMQADVAAFAAAVATLAAMLGMPMAADPFQTAELLIARRDAARTLASTAKEAGAAHDVAVKRANDATQQHRDAAAILAGVVAACGAPDAEAAERLIIAARERARQEAAQEAASVRLREIGGGTGLDVLAAESAALPQDQFEAARRQADAALTQARQNEQTEAVALAALERRYAVDAVATSAAGAAESEAAIAAEAGRLLDEYLLLRLASSMLGRALDRVEEHAGPTGIQRVAAAFEAITDGAWTVRAGENAKGETLLLALERAANEPAKQIDQLSEGTRDQLYLALRLVAIEAHVAVAPPLPFIADDILQTFDDTRARAAMQALIGLSQHVQVIVLTHHPHLLEVARGLPVHVQRL